MFAQVWGDVRVASHIEHRASMQIGAAPGGHGILLWIRCNPGRGIHPRGLQFLKRRHPALRRPCAGPFRLQAPLEFGKSRPQSIELTLFAGFHWRRQQRADRAGSGSQHLRLQGADARITLLQCLLAASARAGQPLGQIRTGGFKFPHTPQAVAAAAARQVRQHVHFVVRSGLKLRRTTFGCVMNAQ